MIAYRYECSCGYKVDTLTWKTVPEDCHKCGRKIKVIVDG
ncbi:unnamed protein product [marine sediment metagenome]|uniref:Uncharacterized protein n=1 Tax=marine sediment metagenome TaxID=412755 RepID=X0VWY4_9ZZZZ